MVWKVFDDPEKSLILQKVFRKSSNILLRKRLVHTFLLHKQFRHTCFVAKTIHTHIFCHQNFFRTLFCCRNALRTLFCLKHDLHTCFHAKTIYAFFLSQKRFTHFVRKVFARWNLPSGKFRLFGPLETTLETLENLEDGKKSPFPPIPAWIWPKVNIKQGVNE